MVVMNKQYLKSGLWILLTCGFALILSIVPLPIWAVWFRPEWVVLVLIFWCMVKPDRINVGFAWLLGLFLDMLYDSLLGMHGLALSIIVYLMTRFYHRMQVFPILHQSFVVFALVGIYQLIIMLIYGMTGQFNYQWQFILPAFTSMLFWPWMSVLLSDYQSRLNV